ncbi:MAG: hypothetical protein JO091_08795 [Acidobacteriaceae bacterium]|nr:hypothetical protein [Acidobacteriaceae bacterium]
MKTRIFGFLVALYFVPAIGVTVRAQSADQAKAPLYIYVSQWAVPRAQWGDMEKLDEKDKSLMDKLVADGTLVGYGACTNLIHQEGTPTHATWMSATSEGNLLKALEEVYAHPGSTSAPVLGASKHWDYFLVSRIYNQRSGKFPTGYLVGDEWDVKAGQMRAYTDLIKSSVVPVYEKLLADGVVTSYGMATEDFHVGKLGHVTFYFTTNDAAGFDKASKAFDEFFEKEAAAGTALQSMVDREGHSDFLMRLRYMNNK